MWPPGAGVKLVTCAVEFYHELVDIDHYGGGYAVITRKGHHADVNPFARILIC